MFMEAVSVSNWVSKSKLFWA